LQPNPIQLLLHKAFFKQNIENLLHLSHNCQKQSVKPKKAIKQYFQNKNDNERKKTSKSIMRIS
jgi:hypothetical protein